MTKVLVTGAAGFIGSTLTDRLLKENIEVVGYDNLSTGRMEFLEAGKENKNFHLEIGDLKDLEHLKETMEGCDFVFHLAANADVQHGPEQPQKDLQENTFGTAHVLEAMRLSQVKKIAFSSTGSVYGESKLIPTPEDAPFPIQTSLYGASKLAGEGLIQAYTESFGFEAYIFRFVSILGERYTHGHIIDFCRQLQKHPEDLKVLGDGTQKKSYLYIQDCIDAMLMVANKNLAAASPHRCCIRNLGTPEYCELSDSIRWICDELGLSPKIKYGGGRQGWVGDNPFIFLDTGKMEEEGWKPKYDIEAAVRKTVRWLQENNP